MIFIHLVESGAGPFPQLFRKHSTLLSYGDIFGFGGGRGREFSKIVRV